MAAAACIVAALGSGLHAQEASKGQPPAPVAVRGWVFEGKGKPGDFTWMVGQPQYRGTLFVFNDNEEQFLAHQAKADDPKGCGAGGGNGAMRPYQCEDPPRAVGIPTGDGNGGYASLTPHVKALIDQALKKVRATALQTHAFAIAYNSVSPDGILGHGIFAPGDDVLAYITDGLKKCGVPAN